MNIFSYAIFPSLINEIECPEYDLNFRHQLIHWIYDYKSKTDSIHHSNRGGWHSPNDLHLYKPFSEFKNFILKNISNVLSIYNENFELSGLWININQKGDYNVCHNHPGSVLSGVFWVKIPKTGGELMFYSHTAFTEFKLLESISKEISKKYNYYSEFEFNPKEGSMIIFPSHLDHDVEPNGSDEDRISISFNLDVIRT